MADVHHRGISFPEFWIQLLVMAVCLTFTYIIQRASLLAIYRSGGMKSFLKGSALTCGLFILGFAVAGMFLPAYA